MIRNVTVIFCLMATIAWAQAQEAVNKYNTVFYDGHNRNTVDFESWVSQIPPGTVVLASELHEVIPTHEVQLKIILALGVGGQKVHVGIEHLSYLDQPLIDSWLQNKISEQQLLSGSKWNGKFDYWRNQLVAPIFFNGWSFGLNAPRWLTGKIFWGGLDHLHPAERAVLPKDFALGSELYKERIRAAMGGHGSEAQIQYFFEAQSAWDDTSAVTTKAIMDADPQAILVVLFGDFHVAYGLGLENRLRSRGFDKILSVSQACRNEAISEQDLIGPHPKFGTRADIVALHDCPPQ